MATENPRDTSKYVDPETALGGADAVEKTSYASTAHGAEPGDAPTQNQRVTAQVRSGGPSIFLWLAGAIAVIVLVVYAIRIFS